MNIVFPFLILCILLLLPLLLFLFLPIRTVLSCPYGTVERIREMQMLDTWAFTSSADELFQSIIPFLLVLLFSFFSFRFYFFRISFLSSIIQYSEKQGNFNQFSLFLVFSQFILLLFCQMRNSSFPSFVRSNFSRFHFF